MKLYSGAGQRFAEDSWTAGAGTFAAVLLARGAKFDPEHATVTDVLEATGSEELSGSRPVVQFESFPVRDIEQGVRLVARDPSSYTLDVRERAGAVVVYLVGDDDDESVPVGFLSGSDKSALVNGAGAVSVFPRSMGTTVDLGDLTETVEGLETDVGTLTEDVGTLLTDMGDRVVNLEGVVSVTTILQAAYAALDPKVATTLYVVTDGPRMYLGGTLVSGTAPE
jgi:hypothetical protein